LPARRLTSSRSLVEMSLMESAALRGQPKLSIRLGFDFSPVSDKMHCGC
jgi:hypothetical protein